VLNLKSFAKWGFTALLICVGIFLISHISQAFLSYAPDQIELKVGHGVSLEGIASQLPGASVANEKKSILYVPYGRVDEYKMMASKLSLVKKVKHVELEKAQISLPYYWFNIKREFNHYLHGDFGSVRSPSGTWETPIAEAMKGMLERSLTYFVPALLFALCSALILSLLASLRRGIGKVLDSIHTVLVAMPDFLLTTLLTFASIYCYKLTGTRLFHVAAAGDIVPFMIPFITISLTPGVLIYGTLRIAIQREIGQDYVHTAKAKGMSRVDVLLSHVLRNIVEDLLAVMPRATNLALTSMVVAEAFCDIFGLGGIIVSPKLLGINAMPSACFVMVIIAVLFHGVYSLLRKRFVVRIREGINP
jgi:oligopeptide transport system permease protein